MKSYWLILSSMCVASCVTNNGLQYEAVSSTNLYHIARVQKGMGEKQVLQIMHKPYQYESFEVCGDIYDVWFYVTKTTGLDQSRMVPQNLTPLTFKTYDLNTSSNVSSGGWYVIPAAKLQNFSSVLNGT